MTHTVSAVKIGNARKKRLCGSGGGKNVRERLHLFTHALVIHELGLFNCTIACDAGKAINAKPLFKRVEIVMKKLYKGSAITFCKMIDTPLSHAHLFAGQCKGVFISHD